MLHVSAVYSFLLLNSITWYEFNNLFIYSVFTVTWAIIYWRTLGRELTLIYS